MARGLSYRDAVALLGGSGRTVTVLDRLTGGLLLAATPAGLAFVAGLFDPKRELATLSGELWTGAANKMRGLSRFDRTERLAAAHAVLVVAAYFDALAAVPQPLDVRDVDLDRKDQARIAGAAPAGERLASVAASLLRSPLPAPSPERPYEALLAELDHCYRGFSTDLLAFVSGLAAWERLAGHEQDDVRRAVLDDVPRRALLGYEDSFHRLATQFPEVAHWANALDHRATRSAVRRVESGLVRLEELVQAGAGGRAADGGRLALSLFHRGELERPILSAGDVPAGITIPSLEDAYVTPDFRAAAAHSHTDIASESWWDEHPVRDDLDEFLYGHLTGTAATRAPLLVLGQPGSGKSVLTRILAARLAPEEYLVVRVVLREVPADADLQTQIEYAVRAATGEAVSWPDLARSSGDALPLVVLDGFDEMLQATGVSHTDYLERIASFQRREAALGRPVAVVVTTRTAVADRARCPTGTLAVRLEPFARPHVEQWTARWNAANAAGLARRGLEPVSVDVLMASADLASQPLLLMMLALYDADGNALSRAGALGHVELYERLLTRFAEREVLKGGAGLADDRLADAVEEELTRLSVVAFAMFNRGRQWSTVDELNADLPVLLGKPPPVARGGDLRAELTYGEQALGRFFFVHQSSATRDGAELRTFEFLHATFGEFLIGRLVARELSHLAEVLQVGRGRARPGEVDDAFLHALLSFMPLTMRGTAVTFLDEQLAEWPRERRAVLREPLLRLLQQAQHPPRSTAFAAYRPIPVTVPARHAAYSCNILLLLLMVGDTLRMSELEVGDSPWYVANPDPHMRWRNLALLWRTQMPGEGWQNLLWTVEVARIVADGRMDVAVRLLRGREPRTDFDPLWMYWIELGRERATPPHGWQFHGAGDISLHVHFAADRRMDVAAHGLAPFAEHFAEAPTSFGTVREGRARSIANALVNLWLSSSFVDDDAELEELYDECLELAEWSFPPQATSSRSRMLVLVLRQLEGDRSRMSREWLDAYVTGVRHLCRPSPGDHLDTTLNRLERLADTTAATPPAQVG